MRLTWKHHVLHGTSRKWRRHQDTVCWVDIQLAQQKGFKFYQTRSNAIILYNTLPSFCIPKVVMMKSREIIFEKVYASPRPPLKISIKDNWMKKWIQKLLVVSEDSQQIQPRSKTQLSSTERPVSEQPSGLLTKEIGKDVLFDCESTNVSTERLVKSCVPVSVERADKDNDADENVDADRTRTGRPASGKPTCLFHSARENRH